MHLDVAGARVGRARNEVHRLRRARICDVDDGNPVGEHVPDIGVPFGDHHLHAVRASALVGVTQWRDAMCVCHGDLRMRI